MKISIKLVKSFFIISIFSKLIGCNLAAGSYPYAEEYELNYSEELVKSAIHEFKEENPEYKVPKITINNSGSWDLLDEASEAPSLWFYFYFYYDNQIIFTWIREASKDRTTFAFVSINKGLNIGKWKDINKDFNSSEKKEEKKKFEDLILNKIKKNLLSKKVLPKGTLP